MSNSLEPMKAPKIREQGQIPELVIELRTILSEQNEIVSKLMDVLSPVSRQEVPPSPKTEERSGNCALSSQLIELSDEYSDNNERLRDLLVRLEV